MEVYNKIKEILEKVSADCGTQSVKQKNWTQRVLTDIAELGKNNWDICCGLSSKQFDSSWLFDLIWYDETKDENRYLTKLELVLELEWTPNIKAIKYDFEKLLIAKANHKVMICQSLEKNKEDLFEYFSKAISTYNSKYENESYLICVLEYINTNAFEFYKYDYKGNRTKLL